MIDSITQSLDEHLENISEWFLDFFFNDKTTNTGNGVFSYVFDKIVAGIWSFKVVLYFVGILFLVAVVKFLVDLIRG